MSTLASLMVAMLFLPTVALGNDAFLCRNGDFSEENSHLELANANNTLGAHLHFYGQSKDCPQDNDACQTKAYVLPGDELIVNRRQDGWACAWYQGKKQETVGWVKISGLTFKAVVPPADWVGNWKRTGANLKIFKADTGQLHVKGFATWGVGVRMHFGDVTGSIQPEAGKATLTDGDADYACRIEMVRIGRYLIAQDNSQCGGANVSFSGVYVR